MKKILFLLSVFLFAQISFAQKISIEQHLKNTIYYLASDSLEGRNTGSEGEKLASDYIINQYLQIGILPKGDTGSFIQTFHFPFGKELSDTGNYFKGGIEVQELKDTNGVYNQKFHIATNSHWEIGEDFFPLVNSGNGHVDAPFIKVGWGIVSKEKHFDEYKKKNVARKIVLIQISTPDGDNPHNEYFPYCDVQTKIKNAEDHHAAGIIFYNDSPKAEDLKYDLKKNSPTSKIPVVFISDSNYVKYFTPCAVAR